MGRLDVGEARRLDVRLHASAHMLETLPKQGAYIGRSFVTAGAA
jgi:hypothetical protein